MRMTEGEDAIISGPGAFPHDHPTRLWSSSRARLLSGTSTESLAGETRTRMCGFGQGSPDVDEDRREEGAPRLSATCMLLWRSCSRPDHNMLPLKVGRAAHYFEEHQWPEIPRLYDYYWDCDLLALGLPALPAGRQAAGRDDVHKREQRNGGGPRASWTLLLLFLILLRLMEWIRQLIQVIFAVLCSAALFSMQIWLVANGNIGRCR